MPETLIPPSVTTVAEVVETTTQTSNRKITCGYCDCILAADGGVLRVSDRVKVLNRQEEKIEALKAEGARLESELNTVRGELATATAALQAKQKASDGDDW